MEYKKRCDSILNDERFFEKKNTMFRKVWGIQSSTGKSVNAETESKSIPEQMIDPLFHGISLDLVNEGSGDIDKKMSFGENSLFKLNSLQTPITLSDEVIRDPQHEIISNEDYQLLQRMHNFHSNNNYDMYLYIDEQLQAITYPNSNFSNNKSFSLKHQQFVTEGHPKRDFGKDLDQRILFQISPELIESDKAYDFKLFKHHVLPDVSKSVKGSKNIITETHRPLSKLVLCKYDGEWIPIQKKEITKTYRVKNLAEDRISTFEVLDCRELEKFVWCYNASDVDKSIKHNYKQLIKLEQNNKGKFQLHYVHIQSDLIPLVMRRFYTRYVHGATNKNALFYKKLISHNQFDSTTFSHITSIIGQGHSQIALKQIINGKNDTDTKDFQWTGLKTYPAIFPKFRMDRMLSAYNKKTGEICVQFLPLIEDKLPIFKGAGIPTTSDVEDDYQTWFFKIAREAERYMSHEGKLLPNCKRRIFSMHLEDNVYKNDKSSKVPNWTNENAPLIHLHILFHRNTVIKEKIKKIEIKFYYNVELLGFDLYGSSDTLYAVERFFSEFISFYDKLLFTSKSETMNHTLRPRYRSKILNLFGGKHYKSKHETDPSKGNFGRNFKEFAVKVINMNDKENIYANVRAKVLREELVKEHTGRWEKIADFLNENLSKSQREEVGEKNKNYENFNHRYRLVALPCTRSNLKFGITPTITERAVDFGLNSLTSEQKSAWLMYHDEISKILEPIDMKCRHSPPHAFSNCNYETYFGIEINKETVIEDAYFKGASYAVCMMSGIEYDMQEYNNYLIEPSEEMKILLGIIRDSGKSAMPVDNFIAVKSTGNSTNNTDPKLKKHPLYDSEDGKYIGSLTKGSFWQFPVQRSFKNRNFNLADLTDSQKSDFAISHTKKKSQLLPIDFAKNKQFLEEYDLIRFERTSLAIGGDLKRSSIRVELPDFLEDSYNYNETNYQEHAKFTIKTNDPILQGSALKESADYNKERKRLRVQDFTSLGRPQRIKKRKTEAIEVQFFLSDGTRPRQKMNGDLTDMGKNGVKYAPIRNVDVTIYNSKLNNTWFDKIKKDTFIEDELYHVAKEIEKKNSKFANWDSINMLTSLHNVYYTLRRLTSASGNFNSPTVPSEISEHLDENGEFYKKILSMWRSVEKGNKTFSLNFKNTNTGRKMLSGPVAQHFLNPYANENPFEIKIHLEEIVMPLNIHNLENDETIFVLTDLDFSPDEWTSIDGSLDKKILGKIDLKRVVDFENKKNRNFVQTFTSEERNFTSGGLTSYPITLSRIHDIKNYKLFFVNSKFDPIEIRQLIDSKIIGKFVVETISAKIKLYINNKLTPIV